MNCKELQTLTAGVPKVRNGGLLNPAANKPYELMENILLKIEENLKNNICIDDLAADLLISPTHLNRLFKFAFNRSVGGYIRSRKLSASLQDLLVDEAKVLTIALDYGFEHEGSYIRSFKREFGFTPGEFRRSGQVLNITSPIHLFDSNKLGNGIFFLPEIVFVPKFHVIGKSHSLPACDLSRLTSKMIKEFTNNELKSFKTNSKFYVGIAKNYNNGEGTCEYISSILVEDLQNIPQGLNGFTFDASLCARFRYIGQYNFNDISFEDTDLIFQEIWQFYNEHIGYALLMDELYFEKIYWGDENEKYYHFEWFTPVKETA